MFKRLLNKRLSDGDASLIEVVDKHISKNIGPIACVLDEKTSPVIHVDLYVVEPNKERPFFTIITSGMAEKPMKVPPEMAGFEYAELLICLPPDWPVSMKAFDDESNWWPFRLLKMLARYPHQNDTWLWSGHTIQCSRPPKPFGPNTEMTGALIGPATTLGEGARSLKWGRKRNIRFFGVYPLYTEELEFKKKNGLDDFLTFFTEAGITELLDPKRRSVVIPT